MMRNAYFARLALARLALARLVLALITSAAASAVLAQDFTPPEGEADQVAGEFLVTIEPATTFQAFLSAMGEPEALAGVEMLEERLPLVNAVVARVPEDRRDDENLQQVVSGLTALPGVTAVQPNFVYHAVQTTPNDPSFPDQYMFDNINAQRAWGAISSAEDVIVAIIDTGVDYRHPDLNANMWRNEDEIPDNGVDDDGNGVVDDIFGANFVPVTPSGDPMDDNRHGTHVAGIVAAVTDNNLQVAGTAWRTQLMAVKFLDAAGSGSTASAIRAINYAIRNGAHIMNNSWGGAAADPLLEEAIRAADNAGILFTAAAGNSGRNNDATPFFPSSYDVPNVLSVMATDRNDVRPSWSHFGPTSVDIAAPGVGILSTSPGGVLETLSGTSMATPVVSGAAALLKAQDMSRGAVEIKRILLDSAEEIAGLAGQSVTGGRLDLAAAVGAGDAAACDQNSMLAYSEFRWNERRSFSENANILAVDFSLPAPSSVFIRADASADRRSGEGAAIFRTGVFNQETTDVVWSGSYRRGVLDVSQQPTGVATQFAVDLPAGDHTIYWKLWLSGWTMDFDSASLSALAVPCVIGPALPGADAPTTAAAN